MEKQVIRRRLHQALEHLPYRSNVRRISLFGSQLHGTGTEESDIDLLVELYQPMSMFSFVHMERDLTNAIGKNVDLSTPLGLSKYIRSDVMQEAESLFEGVV